MFDHIKELALHAASLREAKLNGEKAANEKLSEVATSAVHIEADLAETKINIP
ncbi:MAG: hypothetical protein IPO92_18715 [Saprospiraceae bacterium]|nr:hypothetical protein [Saprospiraceae bacterium]